MLIKNTENNYSKKVIRKFFKKHIFAKRFLFILFFIIILIFTNILSLYKGADLQSTGRTHYIKRWGLTLTKKPFSIVKNYFLSLNTKSEIVDIQIKHKNYQELAFQRELAIKYGNKYRTHPENKGYVKAKIKYKGKEYDIKIKLKGGQLDHWGHEYKWSFKVKMAGEGRILGLKYFSLQQPRARSYLNEWVLHKMFVYEDIIGLKYDFIELKLNGTSYGIYAIEENMDKILVERNSLREGVIVNFNTDLKWDEQTELYNYFYAADINSYSKVETDSLSMQQYKSARTLLELFREQELPIEKVFDLEKMAKFFAIIDLTGNYHAISLYNLKFYYNPITSLLEPIGYDNGWFLLNKGKRIIGANRIINNSASTYYKFNWINALFYNKDFYKLYLNELQKISKKDYLDKFFEHINEELTTKRSILHKSYPWYNNDNKFERIYDLYDNQKYINNFLFPNKSIHAYKKAVSKNKDTLKLQIANIYHLPIEILGIKYEDKVIYKPINNNLLQPIIYEITKYHDFDFTKNNNLVDNINMSDLLLSYKILGIDSIKEETIFNWQYKVDNFIETDFIRQDANYKKFDFLEIDEINKIILFKTDNIDINENVIIPQGYKVFAFAGTTLNLTNSSILLTYSPINFKGTEENPININSSDTSSLGFVVMNAKSISVLNYVFFENLHSPKINNWSLPSAVTFYESPANFSFCRFSNNYSEDAINLFRSDYNMNNCFFINTQSDALDADFCNGTVSNTDFINIGNDGIDVSGSIIKITNVSIENAGDKGVSAGENSLMKINNLKCTKTEIAVASKDKSEIKIDGITILDCKIGFTAFQKKPEFDFATIIAKNLTINNTELPFLIETNSVMYLDNKIIPTSKENVKTILYGNEYGKSSK